MAKITIDKEKCKGCLLCVDFCPKDLIRIDKNLNRRGIKPVIFTPPCAQGAGFNQDTKCLGCALCAIICPDCCIEVWK